MYVYNTPYILSFRVYLYYIDAGRSIAGKNGGGGRGSGNGVGARLRGQTGAALPAWAHLGGLTPLERAQVQAIEVSACSARDHGSRREGSGRDGSGPDGSGPESSGPDGSGPEGGELEDVERDSMEYAGAYASAYAAGCGRGFDSAYAPDVCGGFQRWSVQGNFEGFAIGDGLAPELTLSPRALATRAQASGAAAELPACALPQEMDADKEARARDALVRESSELGLLEAKAVQEDYYGDVM